MTKKSSNLLGNRMDVCSLEADMAFFEARLSLAGETPDTKYQQAQIKAYRTLGALMGDTLKTLQPKRGDRSVAGRKQA
jgi:hypothetical protein